MTPTTALGEARELAGVERAVWRILNGHGLDDTAAAAGIRPRDLRDAADLYRRAGHQALRQRDAAGRRAWWQANIEFPDFPTADQTAAQHLRPLLDPTGATWWFMRKHPDWRVRVQPPAHTDTLTFTGQLAAQLNDLVDHGVIRCWRTAVYEPETAAFGGPEAMDHAHALFAADSRSVLDLVARPAVLGHRELWVMTCSAMMHAARLEWYELGDVWHRVAQERPLPTDITHEQIERLAAGVRHVLRADTSPDGPLLGDGPLAALTPWVGAFRELGAELGTGSRTGMLQRGLRDVLSYHAIFHGNRLGLSARDQANLAHAARAAILGTPEHPKPDSTAPAPRTVSLVRRTAPTREAAAAVHRFPLIRRPRRPCPDLDTRIAEVQRFADTSNDAAAPTLTRIDRACSAWNLAALAAADAGMPELAVGWCIRQFRILHAAWPVTGPTAIAALQPLVNLARLTNRDGNPLAAYQALNAISRAVLDGGHVHLHGLAIDFDRFTTSDADRKDVIPWLHGVLRDDGTRALAATGRWKAAAAHAALYDDDPHLLYEAGQTRILAAATTGDIAQATALIHEAVTDTSWERAIGACLFTYTTHTKTTDMLQSVTEALDNLAPRTALFNVRLGLTALDLATTAPTPVNETETLAFQILRQTLDTDDAFLADAVLRHTALKDTLNMQQHTILRNRITRAALHQGTLPPRHIQALTKATAVAEAVLSMVLGTSRSSG
jgi:thiopeptide-type bacteriocin biosynthesis protein